MIKKSSFWDTWAWIYEVFMKKNTAAYKKMYALIRPVVVDQTVLELATGTGMIARNIADAAKTVIATDCSEKMLKQARKRKHPNNVVYSRADLFHLPYEDHCFSVVIIANALHIIPDPEKALEEIYRVLTPDGVLIAPTFTHAKMIKTSRGKAKAIRLFGFPLQHAWSPKSFCKFLESEGWMIEKKMVLNACFPLTYVQCQKRREDVR